MNSLRESLHKAAACRLAQPPLTTKELEAVNLFREAGLGQSQIGRQLGITPQAVRKRLISARAKLEDSDKNHSGFHLSL